jgi:hypothetical protein
MLRTALLRSADAASVLMEPDAVPPPDQRLAIGLIHV